MSIRLNEETTAHTGSGGKWTFFLRLFVEEPVNWDDLPSLRGLVVHSLGRNVLFKSKSRR